MINIRPGSVEVLGDGLLSGCPARVRRDSLLHAYRRAPWWHRRLTVVDMNITGAWASGPCQWDAHAASSCLHDNVSHLGSAGRCPPEPSTGTSLSPAVWRRRPRGAWPLDDLISRNNLAHAYEAVGALGRAIPLHESTLADSERVLGPDHPNTLASRNNLTIAYQALGDLGRAIPLL